ncbi:MAG: hypothetical protein GDA46_03400 [Bdellovibrionales bacterium]|nr:hypothetical protein [Bdellovibrionales bacterium]
MSFVVNEDIAWKTMVKVFKAYPLKTIDPHLAYIETEEMKGDRFWKAPHEEDQNFYGYSYIIKAHLNYKEPISTVTISKKIYRQKGFISKKEELPSDYLEETALFYHILRELELKKKLNISS